MKACFLNMYPPKKTFSSSFKLCFLQINVIFKTFFSIISAKLRTGGLLNPQKRLVLQLINLRKPSLLHLPAYHNLENRGYQQPFQWTCTPFKQSATLFPYICTFSQPLPIYDSSIPPICVLNCKIIKRF